MSNKKIILYKSITWRVLAIITSYLMGMFFGLGLIKSLVLTVILNLINAIAYATHEWLWLKFYKK